MTLYQAFETLVVPLIVLACGVEYFVSLLAAPGGLLAGRLPVRHHLES